ncbi:unnamed protein product [Cuscuta europaea]|uniref:Uncharacterized protein n=1 Tax=Cuscuta europaea TaxID=41803 RepID=A0A9P0Z4J7_CUSEU|nr:unnamed protein product [Cuscuta europaea]
MAFPLFPFPRKIKIVTDLTPSSRVTDLPKLCHLRLSSGSIIDLTPSQPAPSTPSLRCRNTVTPPADSPKQQSKSPRFFHSSQPSSPRSPSAFSLLKSSLRLSKGYNCLWCGLAYRKWLKGLENVE